MIVDGFVKVFEFIRWDGLGVDGLGVVFEHAVVFGVRHQFVDDACILGCGLCCRKKPHKQCGAGTNPCASIRFLSLACCRLTERI